MCGGTKIIESSRGENDSVRPLFPVWNIECILILMQVKHATPSCSQCVYCIRN